jgi:hypothetical protein
VGLIGENPTIVSRLLTGGLDISDQASGGSRKIHGGDEALGAVGPRFRRQGPGSQALFSISV